MKRKVLIVEDEPNLLDAYSLILEHGGFAVTQASDGNLALRALEKNNYDLVLLDLRMPNKNGLEFLDEFNEIESASEDRPKIIVFSNLDSESEINQAYNLGADKYLLKAWVSPKELLKVVGQVLEEK